MNKRALGDALLTYSKNLQIKKRKGFRFHETAESMNVAKGYNPNRIIITGDRFGLSFIPEQTDKNGLGVMASRFNSCFIAGNML